MKAAVHPRGHAQGARSVSLAFWVSVPQRQQKEHSAPLPARAPENPGRRGGAQSPGHPVPEHGGHTVHGARPWRLSNLEGLPSGEVWGSAPELNPNSTQ